MSRCFIIGSIAALSLALGGCNVLSESSSTVEPFVPVRPYVPATPSADFGLTVASLTVAPDLSVWEEKTSAPEIDSDLGVIYTDWACGGFAYSEPPRLGPWRFVGTVESYTPVLDIVADRTGLPLQSNTIYYYFRLHPDDE